MTQNEQYLKVAIKAARENGNIFKQYFGKPRTVNKKNNNPRDLVTEIDQEIETRIRKTILKNFPSHKIIGEEHAKDQVTSKDLVWIIDPIDGTTNYIQGLPWCCISIALWDENGPLVGVVYNPILNTWYTSLRNKGAFLNGKKIKISETTQLKNAIGAFGWMDPKDGIKLYLKLIQVSRKLRVFASSVMTTGFIAQGSLDFYVVDKIFIWDFAAGAAILLEAGGKITDIQGKPFNINSKSVIISNGKIHNQLLNKLKNRPD